MGKILESYMLYVKGKKYNFLIDMIFTPLSWITGLTISIMDFFRAHGLTKTQEPPLPLISVGNLTYGGTNKTPFVCMLAHYAISKGIKVGIVTRGYSGRSNEVLIIRNGEGNRFEVGDEPLLLSRELPDVPVAVAKSRLEGVEALKARGVELVIADDAFQHRAMFRDVDIVLIDALCPWGSGKLIPAGTLREKISALSRADILVLTKSEQATPEDLEKLKQEVKKYIAPEKIFTSEIKHDGWINFNAPVNPKNKKAFAFSAIGSPESFIKTLRDLGVTVVASKSFRDHHSYSQKNLESLQALAKKFNADFITCTEKDLFNFPESPEKSSWNFDIPLAVPKVRAEVNNHEKFFALLAESLRPKIIVASNGYGEDAIGVVLAKKLRERLPESKISIFPLVGRGEAYKKEGFEIASTLSDTPSGGVLKYSLKDLFGDMRAGLISQVKAQLKDWRKIAGKIRTPVCVGDVYLLLHTLWGSGARPIFIATAKTVYLSGHWRIERAIIRRYSKICITRDKKSAEQLGHNAIYAGNPIMDLLGNGNAITNGKIAPEIYSRGDYILLLPGSRTRACKDVKLLLDAVDLIAEQTGGRQKNFRMTLAPTLIFDDFFAACESYGWKKSGGVLSNNKNKIELNFSGIADSVKDVKILLGFGGTANQLCAGLGIPVISIDEKGKRVQKKLLGDAEILVDPTAQALAASAISLIQNFEKYSFMSSAGIERMGTPGALDFTVNFGAEELGWEIREKIFKKMNFG